MKFEFSISEASVISKALEYYQDELHKAEDVLETLYHSGEKRIYHALQNTTSDLIRIGDLVELFRDFGQESDGE